MMNCHLYGVACELGHLFNDELKTELAKNRLAEVSEDEATALRQRLGQITRPTFSMLGSDDVDNAIFQFDRMLESGGVTYSDVNRQLCHLRQVVYRALQKMHLYRYPEDKAKILINVDNDWEVPFAKFGSAKPEISAGIDCWALGHPTASIFHLMRAAEIGLRALARERQVALPRNKPLEWGQWGEIIRETRRKVDEIRQKPAGATKDAALTFYDGALAHMEGFADKYRNQVMHVRKRYEDYDATSAMMHVREFLTVLGAKTDETGKSVRWRF
jgi:hypothetical protein